MITQLEAHLMLRAMRNGDPYGYAKLFTQEHQATNGRYAAPFHYSICSTCGIVQLDYCAAPLRSGCIQCCKTGHIHSSLPGSQQYWAYHNNMLWYFAKVTLEEHQYFETALQLMWELQENVSL